MQNTNLSKLEAIIYVPASKNDTPFHPFRFEIFGLSIFERCARALEKAGVEHITIVAEEELEKAKSFIESAINWQLSFSMIRAHEIRRLIKSYQLMPPSQSLIVLKSPLILDARLIDKRLKKLQRTTKHVHISKNHQLLIYNPKTISQLDFYSLSGENTISPKSIYKTFSTSFLCQPVTNENDVKTIERKLLKSLTKPNDGWVSRNLNRPISTLFSRLLSRTNITPNQVTLLMVIPSLVTGYILAQGGYWGFLIGGALFHLTSILDGVDGELARLKFKSSLYGKWLDFMCDNLAYLAALIGFLVGLFRDGISPFEKTASLTALVLTVCMMTSIILYYKRFNKDGKLLTVEYSFREGNSWLDKLMQTAELLGKREWFALIFFVLAIFGKMEWTLVYVCVVAAGVLLFSFEAHARAARLGWSK